MLLTASLELAPISALDVKFPILQWILYSFFGAIALNFGSLVLLLAARRFFRAGLAMSFVALILGFAVLAFSIYNYAVNGVNASLPVYKVLAVPAVPAAFASMLIWRWFRMLGQFKIIGKGR